MYLVLEILLSPTYEIDGRPTDRYLVLKILLSPTYGVDKQPRISTGT